MDNWEGKQFLLSGFVALVIVLLSPFHLSSSSSSLREYVGPLPSSVSSLPLSVSSRWIIDESGKRVKLACVNWASHLETMLPEGLEKQPVPAITGLIVSSGFNCVRLTWATYMFTRPEFGGQTVEQSLSSLSLNASLDGVFQHNPNLTQLTLKEAYAEVVRGISERGLMMILDNHVSKPGWCCGWNDGNGFWGDQFFDPEEWLRGLDSAAKLSLDHPHVIGVGLRNEPRGPRQNSADWRKYISAGAEKVHSVNKNLLICAGGLSFSADLSFLNQEPLAFTTSSIRQKLVYEVHWYSWYSGAPYGTGNLNHICANDMNRVYGAAGFLLAQNQSYTSPLLVSEFGLAQSGQDLGGNRFFDCFMAFAAIWDLEYALWALQGSYYRRDGVQDLDETFGLLTHSWNAVRNPGLVQRLRGLQYPLPGPTTDGYSALFHPASGLCVSASANSRLVLSDCGSGSSLWSYDVAETKMLRVLLGTDNVVSAVEEGSPVVITSKTSCVGCQWTLVGEPNLQLSIQIGDKTLCLDGTSGTDVTVETCLCVTNSDCISSPQVPTSQWFHFTTEESFKGETYLASR